MKISFPLLRRRPPVALDFLEVREHFLPIRVAVLMERMLLDERLDDTERENLKALRRLLADRFHYEYHVAIESLKNDFVPFDPDRETLIEVEPKHTDEQLREIRERLYEDIIEALKTGNYRRLTLEEFNECLKLQPIGGLSVHVDVSDFDQFDVYYRGVREHEETRRPFLRLRRQTYLVKSLNRVFVIVRFKPEDGGHVLVKMFKDVPVKNIKIIAPKAKLRMPVIAQIKVIFATLIAAWPAIFRLYFILYSITFAATSAVAREANSYTAILSILIVLPIAAFKGTMSFLNSRTKYKQVYSSSLYNNNLANNTAALTTLLDAAETQELKEALLGYFILYLNRDRAMTLQELDEATEHWIDKQFGHKFDFEVDDAIRKLEEKKLLHINEQLPGQPGYRVCSLPEALAQLDKDWDGFNTFPDATTI